MRFLNKKIVAILGVILLGIVIVVITLKNWSSSDTTAKPVFKSFAQVKEEMADCKNLTYDNLTIDTEIKPCNVDALYEFEEVSNNEVSSEDTKTRALNMFRAVTKMDITESDTEDEKYAPIGLLDKDNNQIMSYDVTLNIPEEKNPNKWMGLYLNTGCLDLARLETLYRMNNARQAKELIYLDRDYDKSIEFDVAGEKYKIGDAVEFAKQYVNEVNLGIDWDDRITLEPLALLVFNTTGPYNYDEEPEAPKDDTYFYQIIFKSKINGIELNTRGPIPSGGDRQYPVNHFVYVLLDEKDYVGHIKSVATHLLSEEKKIKQKFITLKSSLDIVSDFLAGESNYKISDISIVYTEIKENNSVLGYAKPYWRFILSERSGTTTQPLISRAVYVEMTTGNIYLYDVGYDTMLGTKIWDAKE